MVICPKDDVIPICTAIAKSYPIYSRKTGQKAKRVLKIEFITQTNLNTGKRSQLKEQPLEETDYTFYPFLSQF